MWLHKKPKAFRRWLSACSVAATSQTVGKCKKTALFQVSIWNLDLITAAVNYLKMFVAGSD